jgi:hypothetical protein
MNRRGRLVAALMLLLAFTVGALAGMAAEEGFGIDWFDFLEKERDEGGHLLAGLGLNADQRRDAERILERQEDQLEEYWEARLPEIRQILDQGYGEIRSMLSPEQQDTFDRRIRDLDGRIPEEIKD